MEKAAEKGARLSAEVLSHQADGTSWKGLTQALTLGRRVLLWQPWQEDQAGVNSPREK